ncbi:MAG TPA: thioredoxin family protein [Alphaproteobacteria bacterium]|nr:thioredoxin family protein [Alphaproteobacteria bacterium]
MQNKIVSHEDWLKARLELLAAEKEFTRQRDALTRRRMAMPWERVEKPYRFEGPAGRVSLADLFEGRSQLIVYHFMLGPDWESGCKSCSFWADNFNGIPIHLSHRDVAFTAISRAPFARIEAYRKRMGWSFPWVSSQGSDFNFDYQVSFTPEQVAAGRTYYNYELRPSAMSEMPGISVFYKNEAGEVFHTYSCYARGLDMLNSAYHYLDLVPRGRDEGGLKFTMEWLRRHDEYGHD